MITVNLDITPKTIKHENETPNYQVTLPSVKSPMNQIAMHTPMYGNYAMDDSWRALGYPF